MNHMRRRNVKVTWFAVLSAVACLVPAAVALASGGGGATHDEGAAVTDLLYRVLNFALLVIILFVVVRKTGVKHLLASRRDEIARKMSELREAKEHAEARFRELEAKLKAFEGRREEILEEFRQDGLREKQRIIEEARRRAEQLLNQAEQTIQREIQAAREKLRRDTVDAAAREAEKIIAERIQDRDQEKLVSEFINKVEKLH